MDLQSWWLPPTFQWAVNSRGGLEIAETLDSEIKPDPRYCPTLQTSPAQGCHVQGPESGRASLDHSVLPGASCHHRPLCYITPLWLRHFSDQSSLEIICQNRLLWWAWLWWGIRQWLLLVFFLLGFILFCFSANCCCWGLISWSQSFLPLTHFTLWLIYFSYFPKDLLTLWKVFYLDTILLSSLVFLPFLPPRFLLISHKESVSRQTSLTE